MLSAAALVVTACGSSGSSSSSAQPAANTGTAAATPSTTGGTGTTAASGAQAKRGLKLAYFSVGVNNTYLQAGIKGAKETAARHGATIDVLDGNFDSSQQLNQIMEAIGAHKYDGFVIEPNNSQQLCAAVKAALSAKISVGITNVPACDAAYDSVYPGTAIFVGGQSPEVYVQWFRQGVTSGSGDYAVVNGPATQGNTLRARQVLNDSIIKQYPNWKLVDFDYADYQSSVALARTQTLLQKTPNVAAIYSSYSGSTPGIISAVKAAGKSSQVRIYDLGGDKTMFAALKADQIASTEVYLPYEEAERGVQAVIAQASGMQQLDGVPVGRFWDLTRDPRLRGLNPFVARSQIAKYTAIGLPEY